MQYNKCLKEDAKKKWHLLYIGSKVVLIIIDAKLLDIKYECYRFNDDLIEAIN